MHPFDGLFEDGFSEVFPVDAGDVFGGVAGFIGDDDVFGEVVFVADDADVEVGGADGAEEGLDAVRFVEVGGDGGGCDAYVVLCIGCGRYIEQLTEFSEDCKSLQCM